jgi:transposase-like protein
MGPDLPGGGRIRCGRAGSRTEQIVAIVHEAESGARAAEVCRRHGVSKETLRRWRVKYRGMEVQEAKRLKALEEENRPAEAAGRRARPRTTRS